MCPDRNHQTLTKPIVSRVSTFHQGRQRRKHRRRRWRSWFVSRILFSAFSSHSSHISIHLFDYCGSGWNWRLRLNDDQSGRLKAKHDEYESDCVFHSSWDYSGRLWHFSKEKRIEKDGGVVGIDTKGEESSWPVKGTFWCQKRRWETSEKEEKNQRINPVDILSERLESLPPTSSSRRQPSYLANHIGNERPVSLRHDGKGWEGGGKLAIDSNDRQRSTTTRLAWNKTTRRRLLFLRATAVLSDVLAKTEENDRMNQTIEWLKGSVVWSHLSVSSEWEAHCSRQFKGRKTNHWQPKKNIVELSFVSIHHEMYPFSRPIHARF